MPDAAGSAPRPPEGDWLGTPYLRLERRASATYSSPAVTWARRSPDWVPENLRRDARA